jgi:hypothetical protein
MSKGRQRGQRPSKEVQEFALHLISTVVDSTELKAKLEELSDEVSFDGLTHIWGPLLYRKAPIVFRPFILSHFSSYLVEKNWRFKQIRWKGAVAKSLEPWMNEVDQADDVELFRRLYSWKLSDLSHKKARAQWLSDIRTRVQKTNGSLHTELSKVDLWYWLDEPTAIELYQAHPSSAKPFILRHLPKPWGLFGGEKRELWTKLAELAKKSDDEDFYFKLYRQQIPIKQWHKEAVELCRDKQNIEELLKALKARHPSTWDKDLGEVFHDLLQIRGKELFPYQLPHLRHVHRGWFNPSFNKLIELAEKKDWKTLWAGLIRSSSTPQTFEKAVMKTLKRSDSEARVRLAMLGGVGHEWNFGPFALARVNSLTDKAAVAVYERFPELLRGPLKSCVSPHTRELYPKLLARLKDVNDEGLLDYLASRLVTRGGFPHQDKLVKTADTMADYYEVLQPDEFARRAGNVLSQVPAFAIWNYRELIRKNRLARLFYARSTESYLSDRRALQDLLEAPEIHAQILAYRALALDSDEARDVACKNLTLLLGTLLRPIHRATRLVAFRALRNAARDSETSGRILQKAREACYLPDLRYPKDDLVGLIGDILHRYPEHRLPEEQPVVFGASA